MDIKFPVYQVIINELLEELSFGKFAVGDPFYTEEMLISRFKVAKMTVREAMRRLVDNGFINRKRGMGSYVTSLPDKPCRIKVTKHCVLGILPGKRGFKGNIPLSRMLAAFHDEAFKKGYMLYLGSEKATPLIEAQVDGIIIFGELDRDNIQKIKKTNIPTITINRKYEKIFPTVTTDMRKAGYSSWNYLCNQGYQQVALVGVGNDAETVEHLLLPGIKQAMTDAGVDESNLYNLVGYNALENLEKLLTGSRIPDALLLMNWAAIYPALRLLDKHKIKMPDDIGVLVHGEKAVELNTPVPLSIISHDFNQAAMTVMDILLKLMRGEKAGNSSFDGFVIERGSCPKKNKRKE